MKLENEEDKLKGKKIHKRMDFHAHSKDMLGFCDCVHSDSTLGEMTSLQLRVFEFINVMHSTIYLTFL